MNGERVLRVLDFYENVLKQLSSSKQVVRFVPKSERMMFFKWNRRRLFVRVILYLRQMIPEMKGFIEQDESMEKVFRWLGFIQGALWSLGVFSVDELKDHNRPDVEIPSSYKS